MGTENHETRVVLVKVDVDAGIAQMVVDLNEIKGVRTHTSCQGTIGEGGPHPYRAYVMCTWTKEGLDELGRRYIVRPMGNGSWGYIHPRSTEGLPDGIVDVALVYENSNGGSVLPPSTPTKCNKPVGIYYSCNLPKGHEEECEYVRLFPPAEESKTKENK